MMKGFADPGAATAAESRAPGDAGDGKQDLLCACGLLLLLALYVPAALDLSRLPEEDAAMLLRYSGHLADGHGIVWNIGEPPVDGATDFLFMALVAAVHKAGVGLVRAAQGVGLLAHAATVLLVFFSARRQTRALPGPWPCSRQSSSLSDPGCAIWRRAMARRSSRSLAAPRSASALSLADAPAAARGQARLSSSPWPGSWPASPGPKVSSSRASVSAPSFRRAGARRRA